MLQIQQNMLITELTCTFTFQTEFHLAHVSIYKAYILTLRGHAVAQLVEALRYKPEGRGFDSRWCLWIFYFYSPGVDSASNRNEYQECFLGVKAAGA